MTAASTPVHPLPAFLTFLEEQYHHAVQRNESTLGFELYRVDLSTWKLRLGDRTPFIVIGEEDARIETTEHLAQSLLDAARQTGAVGDTPFVLTPSDGSALRDYFAGSFQQVVVLDEQDQRAVMASHRPTANLLERISAQLSLLALSPYETSKPVTGSRFFGRESVVRRILTDDTANYAVMGIRRIGKTSLLKEVHNRWTARALAGGDREASKRILYMDVSPISSPELFMREVVRSLQPRELVRIDHRRFPLYFPDFLARMAHQYHGPIVFLLDEFDALLSGRTEDRQLLDTLRAASNAEHARFIVAGYRRLLTESSNQASPVFNFAKPLRLKEFTRSDTAPMIVEPMRNLGILLEQQNEIVDRVYEETAGQPNLIQFYCQTLIQQLDEANLRVVTPESLFGVHENEDLRAFVLNTFFDNTSHLEKAMVFVVMSSRATADADEFTLEEIDRSLGELGVACPLSDLEQASRNLVLAGTFAQVGLYYRFATPLFPRILRESHQVDFLLRKVLQEGVF